MRTIMTKDMTPAQREDELARRAPALALAAEQEAVVRDIIADVRARGDDALLEYTREFDWPGIADPADLAVTRQEFGAAKTEVGEEFLAAVQEAAAHVRAFHERQVPRDWMDLDQPGVVLGQKFTPIQHVGIHVPGYTASYPSTAIMTVVPAQVAGVEEITVVTPARKDGAVHPATLATLGALGATRVFKVGGAQAIAALAYGTDAIRMVAKIFGPGSIWITLAKKLVYGDVGIDGLYGPSEVAILADETADPRVVAADLLAQAEHGGDSRVFLVTPSQRLAEQVEQEVERQVESLARKDVAEEALEYAPIYVEESMDQAIERTNWLAAEHVQICTAEPFAMLSRIRNAGAIFVGQTSPVPLGDYVIGPSHSLHTGSAAHFSSGLGVVDFMKRSGIIYTSAEAVKDHADTVRALAKLEGFDAHIRAVEERL